MRQDKTNPLLSKGFFTSMKTPLEICKSIKVGSIVYDIALEKLSNGYQIISAIQYNVLEVYNNWYGEDTGYVSVNCYTGKNPRLFSAHTVFVNTNVDKSLTDNIIFQSMHGVIRIIMVV